MSDRCCGGPQANSAHSGDQNDAFRPFPGVTGLNQGQEERITVVPRWYNDIYAIWQSTEHMIDRTTTRRTFRSEPDSVFPTANEVLRVH